MNLTHILLTLAVLAVLIIVFLVAVLCVHIKRRVLDVGIILATWRYVSGLHWTGEPQVTIDGKALSKDGRVSTFYVKHSRWQRAKIRCARLATPVSLLLGFAEMRLVFYAAAGSLTLYRSYRAHQAIRHRRAQAALHRTYLVPLHSATHDMCGQPRSLPPGDWITLEPDRSRVEFALPAGVTFTDRNLDRLVAATGAKLGLSSPRPVLELEGAQPRLIIESHPAPPDKVSLDMLRHHLESLGLDELMLGLGVRSAPVSVSLSGDSPHLGMSMRSGRGKSILARFLIAQALAKGWIVVVLDIKEMSQHWCHDLPGVIYARTPAEIHETMLRLGQEMTQRNAQARQHADYEGNVGELFKRILVVAEEMNMTQGRLRTYWRDVRGGKGTSPAILALGDLSFAGRQVLVNLCVIAQRLSAKSAGDGDIRENIGAKFINGSKRTWDMLAEGTDMPPISGQRGRFHLVVDDEVREVQAPYVSAREAREMALAGPWRDTGDTARGELFRLREIAGQPYVTVSDGPAPVSPDGTIALSAASLDKGLALIPMTLAALHSARRRRADNGFPEPVSKSGEGEKYDVDELAAWYEKRYGKVTVPQ